MDGVRVVISQSHVTNDALPVSHSVQRARRGPLGIGQDGVYHATLDGQSSPVCLAPTTRALLLRLVAGEFRGLEEKRGDV